MFFKELVKLGSALAIVVCLCGGVYGQQPCKTFGGTLYAWYDGKAWIGEGDFLVGDQLLHAKVVDVNTALEQHGDMWWGTETATFDFGGGNKMDLMTEFTTEHMKDPNGLFHVNMVGTFAHGAGRLNKVSGHFTSQGPFGQGVVLPGGKTNPPAGVSMYWIGHYDGAVCGVGK